MAGRQPQESDTGIEWWETLTINRDMDYLCGFGYLCKVIGEIEAGAVSTVYAPKEARSRLNFRFITNKMEVPGR